MTFISDLRTVFWRRLDLQGLEKLDLSVTDDGVRATSTILSTEGAGFRLDYDWRLDARWRTKSLELKHLGEGIARHLLIERTAVGWLIDGLRRPDLDHVHDVDISATPFCNTLAIRQLGANPGDELTFGVIYVDAQSLSSVASRQRYIRKSGDVVRYVDLATALGFEADLCVDRDGFVVTYEGLFEQVSCS